MYKNHIEKFKTQLEEVLHCFKANPFLREIEILVSIPVENREKFIEYAKSQEYIKSQELGDKLKADVDLIATSSLVYKIYTDA